MEDMDRRHEFYIEDAKKLEKHLADSRQEWLDKLDRLHEHNEQDIQPAILECASLQDKVEKLQLKKDELARSIHPERYAVADVSGGVNEIEFTPRDNEPDANGRASDDDEEDPFAGLGGLEENRASGAEASEPEDEVAKKVPPAQPEEPTKEAPNVQAAGGAAGGDPSDDDDEALQPQKRPRLGEDA